MSFVTGTDIFINIADYYIGIEKNILSCKIKIKLYIFRILLMHIKQLFLDKPGIKYIPIINPFSPFIQYTGHIFISENINKKRTLPVTEGVKLVYNTFTINKITLN